MTELQTAREVETKLDELLEQVAALKELLPKEATDDGCPKNLLVHSAVALYVSRDGILMFASPQMRQVTGYSEHELIGRNPLSFVYQEDKQAVARQTRRLQSNGGSIVQEYRIVTKNAKVKWVVDNACTTEYEGAEAIVGNLVDITKHKEEELAKEKENERYRELCESATDLIQCVGINGQILYANKAWHDTLGYSEKDIARLSLFDIVPSDSREHWVEVLQRASAGEVLRDVESVILNRDGFRIPLEGTIGCRFIDGRPAYAQGIFRDLSKRREETAKADAVLREAHEINKRLQQSNNELEEFAYIASHDLQEPLRKISSFGEILQMTLSDKIDDDQRENLGYMIDGAKRMQAILDDLLSYSRISTAAKPHRYVDPNAVIDNLKKFELSELLAETGGKITVPKILPGFFGDESQMHQLFQNLIANGLKFHKGGIVPTIMVSSALAPNGMIRFSIEDNGIGIDPEYHEQIFLMFKRLHSASAYRGTGIGLAICKKIVQRHGGEIGVKSQPGNGSTFWFTIRASDNPGSDPLDK